MRRKCSRRRRHCKIYHSASYHDRCKLPRQPFAAHCPASGPVRRLDHAPVDKSARYRPRNRSRCGRARGAASMSTGSSGDVAIMRRKLRSSCRAIRPPSASKTARTRSRVVPATARDYILGHAGRQVRLGPVAFWIVIGTLVIMAGWSVATGTYFAFHDDVLTRLIGRQAEMQFAYEDRIAELRAPGRPHHRPPDCSIRSNSSRSSNKLCAGSRHLEQRASTHDVDRGPAITGSIKTAAARTHRSDCP